MVSRAGSAITSQTDFGISLPLFENKFLLIQSLEGSHLPCFPQPHTVKIVHVTASRNCSYQ